MVVVETDILVSLILSTEKHHREVVEIVKRVRPLALSPYSLVELDLLVSSRRIVVRDLEQFYRELSELLEFYGIRVLTPSPSHLAIAQSLRERYSITYFDSLHAATAIAQRDTLASYDRSYSRIEELRWIYPAKLLVESP
ncbi:MAG: hypothetical protein DRO13_03710 [Thermoprotei archaeon]|nr:MAG: hypothetical protein DRO13_03710 [Thermoprotei archaeon]